VPTSVFLGALGCPVDSSVGAAAVGTRCCGLGSVGRLGIGVVVKILLLTHRPMHPIHDGYNLHNYNYVKRLAVDHELHLVSLEPPAGESQGEAQLPEDLGKMFASTCILPARSLVKPRGFRRVLGALSPDDLHDFDPAVYVAVLKVMEQHHIDLVWTAGAKMLVYSHRLGLPTLGDIADEAVKEARIDLSRAGSFFDWVRAWRSYLQTWRFQRKYLEHVSICTVVSETDKETLNSHCPGLEVRVVPNGVDHETYAPQGVPEDFPSLVFEGTMNFRPNEEGIQDFVKEVLPLILKQRPDVKLFIVGKDPIDGVKALASDGVTVTGFVDDVKPWVEKSSVFVCPLKRGTGIKNKILQAWSLERPVVATTVSCGGLPLIEGVNMEVADDPKLFAEKVLALLDDPKRRATMGRFARQTAIEKCSWELAMAKMQDILNAVVRAPKSRA
jgi:polysaccharide biosynthesis protein PslH